MKISKGHRRNFYISDKAYFRIKKIAEKNEASMSSVLNDLIIQATKEETHAEKMMEADRLLELGMKMKEELELESMTINKDKQTDLKAAIDKFLDANTRSGYRVFRKTHEIKMAIEEMSYRFSLPREQVHGYMVEEVKRIFKDPDERLLMMRRLQELEGKYAV